MKNRMMSAFLRRSNHCEPLKSIYLTVFFLLTCISYPYPSYKLRLITEPLPGPDFRPKVAPGFFHRSTFYRGMCTQKELDKPVKFSSSNAALWKAAYSRSGGDPKEKEEAWFQPYVVIGSVAAFLVYFCILREESDIDKMIYVPLHDKIDGLEEQQLRSALQYNLDKGLPTADIKKRIGQLEKENQQRN